MGFLSRLRLRRAARRYARSLGPALASAYGTSTHYKPEQIRAAVARLRLDESFIVLGYAKFLPRSEFKEVEGALPIRLGYEKARAAIERFRPPRLRTASIQAAGAADAFFLSDGTNDSCADD